MEIHSIFYRRRNRGKIAEIGSGRRGKSKILVQKTGVLNNYVIIVYCSEFIIVLENG
jgi:hypothetical protein